MIRALFYVALIGVVARVILGLRGLQTSTEVSAILSTPIALFFGLLFLHINNESENTSLIMFILTWISIVAVLYV